MVQTTDCPAGAGVEHRRPPYRKTDICITKGPVNRAKVKAGLHSRIVNESYFIDKYRSVINTFLYTDLSILRLCGDEPQQEGTVPGGSR